MRQRIFIVILPVNRILAARCLVRYSTILARCLELIEREKERKVQEMKGKRGKTNGMKKRKKLANSRRQEK